MAYVEKDSGHVTCHIKAPHGLVRAHTSSLVKKAYPWGKGLVGVVTEDQMLCANRVPLPKHTPQENGVSPWIRESAQVGREACEPGSEPSLVKGSLTLSVFLGPVP